MSEEGWGHKTGINLYIYHPINLHEDNYLGLIIPESLTAFGIFLMRQILYSLPDEIIDSARIQGTSVSRIF